MKRLRQGFIVHKLPKSEAKPEDKGCLWSYIPGYRGLSVIFSSGLVQWVHSSNEHGNRNSELSVIHSVQWLCAVQRLVLVYPN